MEPIVIETERLTLRPWRPEDAADMFAYARDPEVGPSAGWPPHETIENSREIIDLWRKHWEEGSELEFALELKEGGTVIGSLGVGPDGARARVPFARSIGYVLGKAYWGRGLMTEAVLSVLDIAFRRLDTKLLTVNHYPDNHRSKRVIEKCGFTYEGRLRTASLLYDGSARDHCTYSMTAAEYWALQAKKKGLALKLPEEVPEVELEAMICEFEAADGDDVTPGALRRKGRPFAERMRHSREMRVSPPPGYAPATLWVLCEGGRLIGAVDQRHCLTERLLETGGHIGYGLRPAERGKGYAPMMLALSLEKAQEMGVERVLVTCNEDNPASAATIERCGGILENRVMEEDGNIVRRYWISL